MPVWDTVEIAEACNESPQFQALGWQEAPDTIESLLWRPAFQEVLADLVPQGKPITVDTIVQAVYEYRSTAGAGEDVEEGAQEDDDDD